MLKLLLLSLLLSSCAKYFEVEKQNGIHVARQVYSELVSAKEVEWKVGRKREVEISKGIRFSFSVPKIDESAKTVLKKKYGVDSWVFRISRQRRAASSPIGFFYYPFSGMSASTQNYTVNLYYHAASVSKRFRLFHCPAFNHRVKIDEVKILDRPNADKADIFLRDTARVPAKVPRIHINPTIFSGGRSLVGKYFVDFAFYNSETKHQYSSWAKVDGVMSITQENPKSVASCVGVKEEVKPLPESRMPNIRDLEIR